MTNRRDFLKAAAFSLAAANLGASTKTMRGIFPIMQTPYGESGRLDTEVLAKEVKFLDRCGVHGVVWPQLASEWSTLEPDERSAGAQKQLVLKELLGEHDRGEHEHVLHPLVRPHRAQDAPRESESPGARRPTRGDRLRARRSSFFSRAIHGGFGGGSQGGLRREHSR